MAKITALQGLMSFQARKRFSIPNGLGAVRFGWSKLGYRNFRAGDYQRHFNGFKYNWVRTRHHWPPNVITEARTTVRNNFASGVSAWHALAPEEKAYYNSLKYPQHRNGFQRFMRKYLLGQL